MSSIICQSNPQIWRTNVQWPALICRLGCCDQRMIKVHLCAPFWFALIENIHRIILETISISQVTFICLLFSIYQDHTLHPLPTWTGTRSIGVPVEFPDNGQWFDRFRYCKCVTSGWSNIRCWSNGSVLQVCFKRMILFSTLEAYSFFCCMV